MQLSNDVHFRGQFVNPITKKKVKLHLDKSGRSFYLYKFAPVFIPKEELNNWHRPTLHLRTAA